jgi:hypothetical protein
MEEENLTRYRIGQFRTPVQLRPGRNLLVLHARSASGTPQVSAQFVGERNDGDSVEGVRWSA